MLLLKLFLDLRFQLLRLAHLRFDFHLIDLHSLLTLLRLNLVESLSEDTVLSHGGQLERRVINLGFLPDVLLYVISNFLGAEFVMADEGLTDVFVGYRIGTVTVQVVGQLLVALLQRLRPAVTRSLLFCSFDEHLVVLPVGVVVPERRRVGRGVRFRRWDGQLQLARRRWWMKELLRLGSVVCLICRSCVY